VILREAASELHRGASRGGGRRGRGTTAGGPKRPSKCGRREEEKRRERLRSCACCTLDPRVEYRYPVLATPLERATLRYLIFTF
jgi:hypothetical protein